MKKLPKNFGKMKGEEKEKNVLIAIDGKRIKFEGYIDEFVAAQVIAFISDQKRLKIIKKL